MTALQDPGCLKPRTHARAPLHGRSAVSWPASRLVDAAAFVAGAALAIVLLGLLEGLLATFWWLACLVVIRSDLDRFIIPDTASAAIAILGLMEAGRDPGSLLSAFAGGAAAFAFFWLVGTACRALSGRDGLGFGDVKLAGACGVWLGAADQVLALEIAAVAALAVALVLQARGSRRGGVGLRAAARVAVPFGAFLAPAAWLVHVTGPALRDLAERLG